jgi:aminomethyltransferase
MLKQTALNAAHRALNARMVDFGGWDMPLAYGSQMEEHHAVRNAAGMFDVSHMTVVDVRGHRVRDFLSYLLANDVAKLKKRGKALYSCMLNERGGVIDDLIVYFMDESWFRMVVNAATRDKDLEWLAHQGSAFGITLTERRDLSILAVQGPKARELVHVALAGNATESLVSLTRFVAAEVGDLFVARTGYTGEDGYEVLVPNARAAQLWNTLLDLGVRPAGLGARDTLRLEAGMNLYGQDMDETVSPYACGLSWTLALGDGRRFIGRDALLEEQSRGVQRRLQGLVLEEKGVLRHGQTLITDAGEGVVLSGTFSPTMGKSIAMASLPVPAQTCSVDLRGRVLPLRLCTLPFVREGKILV